MTLSLVYGDNTLMAAFLPLAALGTAQGAAAAGTAVTIGKKILGTIFSSALTGLGRRVEGEVAGRRGQADYASQGGGKQYLGQVGFATQQDHTQGQQQAWQGQQYASQWARQAGFQAGESALQRQHEKDMQTQRIDAYPSMNGDPTNGDVQPQPPGVNNPFPTPEKRWYNSHEADRFREAVSGPPIR